MSEKPINFALSTAVHHKDTQNMSTSGQGIGYTGEDRIEEYISAHIQPESSLLKRIYRETNLKMLNPRMASGHIQGRLISMFVSMIRPQMVLEVGTFTGYATLCIAESLPEGGRVHTIEIDDELEDFITDSRNIGYYEGLFEKLASSTMLALMLSANDLSDYAADGIISMKSTGPLAQMYVDMIGGEYATLFTSHEKMDYVGTDYFKYSQIVNVATLVNFVLSEDMDGIIINPESDNVLIPRSELLKYCLGFEKFANDERLSNAIYYLFI